MRGEEARIYDNDGRNDSALLPPAPPGYYQEWTVQANGKEREDGRLVIGGPPDNPNVIYFTDGHYKKFTKVYP